MVFSVYYKNRRKIGYNTILWARENRALAENKLSARYFRPDETLTRAEFALMLYQFNLYEGGGAYDPIAVSTSAMTDMELYDSFTRNAMLGWAYPKGVLRGTTATTMNPGGTLTRAHVAAMLCRYDTMVRGAESTAPTESGTETAIASTGHAEADTADGYKITISVPTTMEVRDRYTVTVNTAPVQERCAWTVTSSNESVASIERSGDGWTLLTAKAPGTTIVTAVNTLDGRTSSVEVTVRERPADTLNLDANMEMRLEIVRLTNELRRSLGLNELVINDALMNAAQEYATARPITHDRKLSNSLCEKYGYDFSWGENLAWNYTNASDVVNGWRASRGHYETMTDASYNEIGIGYYSTIDNELTTCIAMMLGDKTILRPLYAQ